MAAGDKVQRDPNYFNPTVQDSPAPNFLGYSKGIEAPRAQRLSEGADDMWANLGNVWRQTVEGTIDTTVQTEFKDKLRKGAEDVRDVANNVTLPAELQKGVSEMDRMKRARDAGTMSDTHYYATMDYLVRKQRQRFPGYGEQIDQAISDILGVVPANALRRELVSAQEAGLGDDDKFWRQYVKENAGYIQRSFGDEFWKAQGEGKAIDRNQVYGSVAKLKADEQVNEVNRNRIALDLAANKQVQDNADVSANQEFWGGFNTMLKVGTAPLGKSYDELRKNMEAAKAVGSEEGEAISANERVQIAALFNNFRSTGTNLMQQTLTGGVPQFGGRSYNQFMSDSGKQGLQKSFDDFMGNFEKELFDKNAGTLTFMAAMDEANHASNIAKIRMQNKHIATASAIRSQNLLGPLGEGIYTTNDENLSNVTNEVLKLHSKEIIAGTGGALKDTPQVIGADDIMPKSEIGAATTGVMRKTIDVITNGDPSDQATINAVESFFGPGNQGFLAGVSPTDSKIPAYNKNQARERIFLELTAPKFIQKINETAKRTGNTALIENVRRWAEDSAGALFKVEATKLQTLVTDYPASGQLYFDSTINQFRIYDYARPGNERAPKISSQFQESLNRVNMSLKALESVYVNTGMDKKEASIAMASFFQDESAYGINLSAAPTAAGTVFSAAYDYLATTGSGQGKTIYAPADSRRRNLGANDISVEAIDEATWADLTAREQAEIIMGERPAPVPGRRTPMETPRKPLREDPEGELKVRYPWPGRMDAGLGDVPGNDNSSWDAVQGVVDRTNENFKKLDATGERLLAERTRVAREQANRPERIVSAALKLKDGSIATGINHAEAIENLARQRGISFDEALRLRGAYNEGGFVTSTGRYVNREEAGKIADSATQGKPTIPGREKGVKLLSAQDIDLSKERAIGAGMLGGGSKNPLKPKEPLAD